MGNYRELIINKTRKYFQELNETDFSHDFNHTLRVERMAKRIAKEENADMDVVEAASLFHDVARILEDNGEVDDHADEGGKIAKKVLAEIDFPKNKIGEVCHAIEVHRKSSGREPKTLEARILQDADHLDALGAIDIARVIASALQSEKYKNPIYDENIPLNIDKNDKGKQASVIHFLYYKLEHPKMQPQHFYTKTGRKMARDRFKYMREFAERFVKEWKGEL